MSGMVEDFEDEKEDKDPFDDFETVAEKPKKVMRASTKPETPKAAILERNRSRKDSDMDTEPVTRS